MSLSFRPRSDAERESICNAVSRTLSEETLAEMPRTLLRSLLQLACEDWQMKRMAADTAASQQEEARRTLQTAETAFHLSLQSLMVDTRTTQREAVSLQQLIGVSPSIFKQMAISSQIRQATLLREKLRATDLICPSSQLSDFDTTFSSLISANSAYEQASQTKISQIRSLLDAQKQLDTAIGKTIRALQALLSKGEIRAIFPAFVRQSAAKATPQ